jgi:hypothetical protein
MKLTPQPDGRIAIVFSAEEDAVLDKLDADAGQPRGSHSRVVYAQLMQPSAPRIVHLLATLPPPKA